MPEQYHDNDSHDDGQFHAMFAMFREGAPLAVPAGAGAARAVVRRRRQLRAGTAVATVAVLLAAVPALAASRPDNGPPPLPGDTVPPSSSPSVPGPSVTTPASPSVSAAPPDGRISAAELGRATLDLPPWPKWLTECPAGQVTFRDGAARVPDGVRARQVTQREVLHLDLDSDGAQETVALISCEGMELHEAKVLAFDRDRAGRIVTMGQVIASEDGDVDAILDIRRAGSAVEVQVVDIFSDGIPDDVVQRQWRGYSWTGGRFVQSSGPTRFPPNPRITDLAASGGNLRMSPDGPDRWTGTVTIDVRNKGPVPATGAYLRVTLPRGFSIPSLPSGCSANTLASGIGVECVLPRLAVGGSRRVSLPVTVATSAAPAGSYSAKVGWSAGEGKGQYPEPDGRTDDNHVDAEIVAAG